MSAKFTVWLHAKVLASVEAANEKSNYFTFISGQAHIELVTIIKKLVLVAVIDICY